MKSREAFEEWATNFGMTIDQDWGNGEFLERDTKLAYSIWQAAIEWQEEQPVEALPYTATPEYRARRDKFAAAALTGLQYPYWKKPKNFTSSEALVEDMCITAYKIADQMLKEREK